MRKTYSQHGQAEWIMETISCTGIKSGQIFEAGAADPYHWSNSRTFIDAGWEAILVEPVQQCIDDWRKEITENNKVTLVHGGIPSHEKGLEDTLKKLNAKKNLEVLFLDIDGGEYQLIKGLNTYRPKVICVEYDAGYPAFIDFVPNQIKYGWQASSSAFYKLMESKDYHYVKTFAQDMIFFSKEFFYEKINHLNGVSGIDAYKHLVVEHTMPHFAILVQRDDNTPENGIGYYSEKLDVLIKNNCVNDAWEFFWYLSHIFAGYYQCCKVVKGIDYAEEYWEVFQKFRGYYLSELGKYGRGI